MGLADFGNAIIAVKEISLSLVFSDGTEPAIDDNDRDTALTAYNSLSETAKEIWRVSQFYYAPLQPSRKLFLGESLISYNCLSSKGPSGWYFPSLEDYLNHLPGDSRNLFAIELESANLWNSNIEAAKNNGLRAYVRMYCNIAVLFFIDLKLGLVMMNYADNADPNKWRVAAQFESSALGLLFSVSVSTVIDFDRRRHLHLEGQDYHRAVANRYDTKDYCFD